ncbi:MAG TPA: NAD-dependent epimerase/dehydratase family protein [Vicinamibacterales bacterium]|nr:NAD-dependent epimerase/dehydratase family protein [Acidobacteriota bacterium]HQX82577.1 NAD-dependent epimerase/dehydratase family protein [Vicinamibacterales bacterium]
MKSVLLTGASGFLGSHLARSFIEGGWRVRAASRRPADGQATNPDLEWVGVGEIGRHTEWGPLLEGVDVVVHAAAVAHRISKKDQVPASVYDEVNHRGTERLAECARRAGVGRFVLISSIGAVADACDVVIDESTPCAPTTAYGRSKLAAEIALADRLTGSACEWCVLRPPLLYGPGHSGNMGRLLRLIQLPLPLPFGAIHNRRSFMYVGNLVSAVQLVTTHPAAGGQVFCVADAETLSTRQLIEALGRASGRRIWMIDASLPALQRIGRLGDAIGAWTGQSPGFDSESVRKLCGSLSLSSAHIRERCGWEPPVRLADGLSATMVRHA